MKPIERLKATLHQSEPDVPCLDFGATPVTGMHVSTVSKLRQALLGDEDYRVKVIEPFQMLGEIDAELHQCLGIDTLPVSGSSNFFGFENKTWKPFTLFDGTQVLVPGNFNVTKAEDGGWLMHPQGDTSEPPCAHMPNGGFYFDAIPRQEPINEDNLDPADNCADFEPLSDDALQEFADSVTAIGETENGGVIVIPGTALGDVALIPGMALKNPKGIRDVEEWYVSTVTRKDYIKQVFEYQTQLAEQNIPRLYEAVGDRVLVAFVCGTDFGAQNGLFMSVDMYKELYSPFYRRINEAIHKHTPWKTFKHSCGSVRELIPHFIADGFDILNPLQFSAADMDPAELKREFGQDIVFWGGGVDTQKTLPFGTAEDVYNQVKARIDILAEGGGFVFSGIHNIQPKTPIENLRAMFRALDEYRR